MLRAIITKELLLLSRDVHALAVLFLMPLAFILIMSLTLQDSMQQDTESNPRIGFWSAPAEAVPESLLRELKQLEGFQVIPYGTEDRIESAVSQYNLVAAISLPEGFADNLTSSQPDPELRLQILYGPTTNAMVRRLVLVSVSRALASYRLDHLIDANSMWPASADPRKQIVMGSSLIQGMDLSPAEDSLQPSSVQQSVPAWLIFSMFFVVIPISTTFLTERQHGTLQRLMTMQVPGGYLLLGKLVPYLVINLIQTLLMFLVGIYLVPLLGGEGLNLGENSPLLIPMSLAVSLTAISFALLVATWVRSTEQATTIGGISNLLLAAIGGIMVPVYIMPGFMQKAASFSPMNWGLEGFFDILLRQGDLAMIGPEISKLLLLSGLLLSIAITRYTKARI